MTGMRILLATDGSTGAEAAVDLIASSFDSKGVELIDALSVTRPIDHPHPADPGTTPIGLIQAEEERRARGFIDAVARRLSTQGFVTLGSVSRGHPADTIVTHAAERRADLVVLGTRGHGGRQPALAGSVAAKVARYAPISVLVARTPGPIREIVLGYDASPDADGALALITRLPLRTSPRVTVCSVWDLPWSLDSDLPTSMIPGARHAYHDVARRAREAASAMAAMAEQRLIGHGIVARHRTARGAAHEQLAAAASDVSADLIAVGSHGLSDVQRFLMGSTTATLVSHPPTSVLVARWHGDRP